MSMKMPLACVILGLALPALAQTGKPAQPGAQDSIYERAKKRCKEQRGSDCESREGLKPWIVEERPMTREQQQAGAAAARHRRECAANKNKPGC
jgi:hypothetical protein